VATIRKISTERMTFDPEPTIHVVYSPYDLPLSTDPQALPWRNSCPVSFQHDNYGIPVKGMRTTIFTRWTVSYLDLLFVCEYRRLHLKPQPQTEQPTSKLWTWDVAELFLGSDMQHIRRYKEFEVSPQAEWLTLDVDLDAPLKKAKRPGNWGFQTAAHIDDVACIWYAAMRIPFAAIATQPVQAGVSFRANLFRSQGPESQLLAWQPPMSDTFHTPERFGTMLLGE
jgi:hypothetical protein